MDRDDQYSDMEKLPPVRSICEAFQNTKTMLAVLLFYMPDFVAAEGEGFGIIDKSPIDWSE